MDRLHLGIVTAGREADRRLADATRRHPDVSVVPVAIDDPPDPVVAGLVVDVPLAERGGIVSSLLRRWSVPILLEAPVARSLTEARDAVPAQGHRLVFSFNPLRFRVPTRRLLADVTGSGDPLESLFAVWRFQPSVPRAHALPQLLDYVGALVAAAPTRVSAFMRADSLVMLALIRYANGVVAHLELGAHLPTALPSPFELLVECFGRDSAYQCQADAQVVTVDGIERRSRDWSPRAEDLMVDEFVAAVRAGAEPGRSVADDLAALALHEEILAAATERTVRRIEATARPAPEGKQP